MVSVEIAPVRQEPEPALPSDLSKALKAGPNAKAVWESITTIARLDRIPWIESTKQTKTRKRRIDNACDTLSSGNDESAASILPVTIVKA